MLIYMLALLNSLTVTVDLSDEYPPAYPLSSANELTVRTVHSNEHTRQQHGIHYPETFPKAEIITFWGGSLKNIDFQSLAELPSLREIHFHENSLIGIPFLAPLQPKENLTLIFFSPLLPRRKEVEALQELLPHANIKFISTIDDPSAS